MQKTFTPTLTTSTAQTETKTQTSLKPLRNIKEDELEPANETIQNILSFSKALKVRHTANAGAVITVEN